MIQKTKIILKRPHLSEKSTDLTKFNQYTFEVAENANKEEIKRAVKENYKVDVLKVRIINLPKKKKIWRNKTSYQKRNKKAFVTLKEGQKIEIGV